MDKNIIFENICMKKPKLCAVQFSKNRKAHITLSPGVFFAQSNKSKIQLTFYVNGLAIVGENNFFLTLKIMKFPHFRFGSKVISILQKVFIILKL
jgi:hypothetical protein